MRKYFWLVILMAACGTETEHVADMRTADSVAAFRAVEAVAGELSAWEFNWVDYDRGQPSLTVYGGHGVAWEMFTLEYADEKWSVLSRKDLPTCARDPNQECQSHQ